MVLVFIVFLLVLVALLDVLSAALLAGDSPWHPLGDWETLVNKASIADLSAGLPGHSVHHVAALLPGDGVALLPGHRGALLLIHVVGPGHGLVLAHLVGHLLALLAGLLNVIAGLTGNLVAGLPGGGGALAVVDVGCLGPGDGATLLARHLATGPGVTVSGALLLVAGLALLLVDSLGHRLADVLAVGLGNVGALLVELGPALLPRVEHGVAALGELGATLP